MNREKFQRQCWEFLNLAQQINGVYLDGASGFEKMRDMLVEAQSRVLRDHPTGSPGQDTVEYLDSVEFLYGVGDPNKPESRVKHRCTQGEYKVRNAKGGSNHVFLANVCLAMLYQYWEDHYRTKVAQALEIQRKDLIVPIMGDLRLIRHSIVHHGSVALPEITQCRFLNWFRPGDRIAMDEDCFETVINLVTASIAQLIVREIGEVNGVELFLL